MYSLIAFLTWYRDLLSVIETGAKFQTLIASLVDMLWRTFDLPISMGLPFVDALVVMVETFDVCCLIFTFSLNWGRDDSSIFE